MAKFCGNYSDVMEAREKNSNETCGACGKLLANHPTTDDVGIKLIQGDWDHKVSKGDILMLFDTEGEAEAFSSAPFGKHPATQPKSRTFIASGFIGKGLIQVAESIDDYTTPSQFVTIRRVRPVTKARKTAKKTVKA